MHEFGLCESIVDAVERRAAGRAVVAVRVRIGAMHRAVDDSMYGAWQLVSAGSVANGSRLDLVETPVQLTCRGCGHQEDSRDPLALCPRCGSGDLELGGGDELLLESITVAEPTEKVEAAHVPGYSR